MKHKLYNRLLSLALAVGLVVGMLPGAAAVDTVDGTPGLNVGERLDAEGLETSKTVTPNEDGTYTVTLDAYATGDLQITDTHVPTDIVLVLDQSGSMDDPFEYEFEEYYQRFGGTCSEAYRQPVYHQASDGTYHLLNVTRAWQWGWPTGYKFTFTCPECNQKIFEKACWAFGWTTSVNSNAILQKKTDSTEIKRMDALKDSVTQFLASVREDAATYNVNHRVAMVGFASQSGYGDNTEILSIEGKNSEYGAGDNDSVGVAYNELKNQDYQNALRSYSDGILDNAIKALATNGATRADLGMEMANKILEQNKPSAGEKRNQVVIMFTDGEPTSGNSFETRVANGAIENAKTIKQNGAKVYTIGIFDGANADGNDSSNKYMTYVSSNYPNASGMNSAGEGSNQGYYLTAKNAGELNEIFEKISGEIGGSNSNLDAKAVMKDVVTQYFELAGTADDIKVYEPKCTGKDGNTFQFEEISSSNLSELQPTYDPVSNTVSVTGFDYKENYVAQIEGGSGGYRGKKLVVQFNIKPKDEFWGGNQVPTNVFESSGIYQEASSEAPVENFVQPNPVDVPLKQIYITGKDTNIYYGGSVPDAAGLVSGINFPNDWHTHYVNPITYSVNNTVSNTEDGTYTVTATLSPLYTGTYHDNTDTANANVNVFKPEITWQDSTNAYGTQLTNEFLAGHNAKTEWKHGAADSSSVTMFGDAPSLTYEFTDETGAALDTLKKETNVKVTSVKSNNVVVPNVSFKWQAGAECADCTDPNDEYQFRIHMATSHTDEYPVRFYLEGIQPNVATDYPFADAWAKLNSLLSTGYANVTTTLHSSPNYPDLNGETGFDSSVKGGSVPGGIRGDNNVKAWLTKYNCDPNISTANIKDVLVNLVALYPGTNLEKAVVTTVGGKQYTIQNIIDNPSDFRIVYTQVTKNTDVLEEYYKGNRNSNGTQDSYHVHLSIRKNPGNLTITKTFSGVESLPSNFAIEVSDSVNAPVDTLTLQDATYNPETQTYTWTLENLNEDTYTVTETGTNVDNMVLTATMKVTDKDAATLENVKDTTAKVKVADNETSTVDITNTYTPADGYLKIVKKIEGGAAFNDGRDTFTFKVTAQSGKDEGKVWYFTIKGAGTVVNKKLPVGNYKVEELSNINYKLTNVEGLKNDVVTISNGNTATNPATVTFTNTPDKTDIPTDGGGVKNVPGTDKDDNFVWKPEQYGNKGKIEEDPETTE